MSTRRTRQTRRAISPSPAEVVVAASNGPSVVSLPTVSVSVSLSYPIIRLERLSPVSLSTIASNDPHSDTEPFPLSSTMSPCEPPLSEPTARDARPLSPSRPASPDVLAATSRQAVSPPIPPPPPSVPEAATESTSSEDEDLDIVYEDVHQRHILLVTLEDSDEDQSPAPPAPASAAPSLAVPVPDYVDSVVSPPPQAAPSNLSLPTPDVDLDVKPDVKPLRSVPIPEFPNFSEGPSSAPDVKPPIVTDPNSSPAPRCSVQVIPVPSPPLLQLPDDDDVSDTDPCDFDSFPLITHDADETEAEDE